MTLRDYEELARRAAPETARITCLEGDPESEHGAHAVRVLVVPQAVPDPGGRLRFEQLVPGDALLERITRHLDERRLIGTRLAVGPPFYQGVTVVATLHAFRGADTDRVRRAGPRRALPPPRSAVRRCRRHGLAVRASGAVR